jgi:hypothetical protein
VPNRALSISKRIQLVAQILSAAMFVYPAGYAMDTASPQGNVHGAITHDALQGVVSEDNLKLIMAANDSQDAPGGEGTTLVEKRRHFDAGAIPGAILYINREKNKALNLAAEADKDPQARLDALRHFGLMLHAMQDFYLRTNYVEMQLVDEANKNDPYNISLVDWNKVGPSFPGLTAAKFGFPGEDVLDKESGTAGGGKTVVNGKATYHTIARDLAVRETQRQWNLFETLVRNRCGERAPAVIAALRQASTPTSAQTSAAKELESTQTIVSDPTKMDDHNQDNLDADQGP